MIVSCVSSIQFSVMTLQRINHTSAHCVRTVPPSRFMSGHIYATFITKTWPASESGVITTKALLKFLPMQNRKLPKKPQTPKWRRRRERRSTSVTYRNFLAAKVSAIKTSWRCTNAFTEVSTGKRNSIIYYTAKIFDSVVLARLWVVRAQRTIFRYDFTEDKPYKCPLCTYRATQPVHVRSHLRNIHYKNLTVPVPVLKVGSKAYQGHSYVHGQPNDVPYNTNKIIGPRMVPRIAPGPDPAQPGTSTSFNTGNQNNPVQSVPSSDLGIISSSNSSTGQKKRVQRRRRRGKQVASEETPNSEMKKKKKEKKHFCDLPGFPWAKVSPINTVWRYINAFT